MPEPSWLLYIYRLYRKQRGGVASTSGEEPRLVRWLRPSPPTHPRLRDLHGHHGHPFVRLVSADTHGDDISNDVTSCPVRLVTSGDSDRKQEPPHHAASLHPLERTRTFTCSGVRRPWAPGPGPQRLGGQQRACVWRGSRERRGGGAAEQRACRGRGHTWRGLGTGGDQSVTPPTTTTNTVEPHLRAAPLPSHSCGWKLSSCWSCDR